MLPAYCFLVANSGLSTYRQTCLYRGFIVANFVANSCKNGAFFVNFKHFLECFKNVENIEKPHNRAALRDCAVFLLVRVTGVEPVTAPLFMRFYRVSWQVLCQGFFESIHRPDGQRLVSRRRMFPDRRASRSKSLTTHHVP